MSKLPNISKASNNGAVEFGNNKKRTLSRKCGSIEGEK